MIQKKYQSGISDQARYNILLDMAYETLVSTLTKSGKNDAIIVSKAFEDFRKIRCPFCNARHILGRRNRRQAWPSDIACLLCQSTIIQGQMPRSIRREVVSLSVKFHESSDPQKFKEALVCDFSPKGVRMVTKTPIDPNCFLTIIADSFTGIGQAMWMNKGVSSNKKSVSYEVGISFQSFIPRGTSTVIGKKY